MHNRLLTKELCSRWFGGSSDCPFCPRVVDLSCHALRDCYRASNIWNHVLPSTRVGNFYNGDLINWVQTNISDVPFVDGFVTWNRCWALVTWKIWSWRNALVHDDSFKIPFRPGDLIRACA